MSPITEGRHYAPPKNPPWTRTNTDLRSCAPHDGIYEDCFEKEIRTTIARTYRRLGNVGDMPTPVEDQISPWVIARVPTAMLMPQSEVVPIV